MIPEVIRAIVQSQNISNAAILFDDSFGKHLEAKNLFHIFSYLNAHHPNTATHREHLGIEFTSSLE